MAVVWFKAEVRKEFCAATAIKFVLMTDIKNANKNVQDLQTFNENQIGLLLLHDSDLSESTLRKSKSTFQRQILAAKLRKGHSVA
jgi:hypothetical protein